MRYWHLNIIDAYIIGASATKNVVEYTETCYFIDPKKILPKPKKVLYVEPQAVWTKQFLWLPKKINDKIHWLSTIYIKHTIRTAFYFTDIPVAREYSRELFTKDDFYLYILTSDNMEKVR